MTMNTDISAEIKSLMVDGGEASTEIEKNYSSLCKFCLSKEYRMLTDDEQKKVAKEVERLYSLRTFANIDRENELASDAKKGCLLFAAIIVTIIVVCVLI